MPKRPTSHVRQVKRELALRLRDGHHRPGERFLNRKIKLGNRRGENKFEGMSVKEIARMTIEDLPEDAGWAEVMERITLNSAISRGLRELDDGKGIPVEEIESELGEWAKR